MLFFNRLSGLVGLCVCLLTLPSVGLAQAPAAKPSAKPAPAQTRVATPAPTLVASMEGITEYTLSNGLKVLLFPDQSKQTITVNITYLVGSRHEGYGETGMAHLLEHMVFKGTPKHPNIPQELTSHGAQPNGTTNVDRTNYFETFASTEENLKWALDLEADRMVNSYVAKKDLETEMTVVRNEFESGENNPVAILVQRILSTSYLWHNYGNSTIGARADIENVPIDRLQAFYKKYYQPDNAVLMIAGKFDPAKTLALVSEYFAPIPKPERQLISTYTAEPTQDGEREVNLRRSGDVQAVVTAYHVSSSLHPDYVALNLLSEALGTSPGGRLYKSLVETKKATNVFGGGFELREPGVLLFGAIATKEQDIKAAEAAMIASVETERTPITEEEVTRAKTEALKNIELTLNSSDRLGLVMSEWIARGDWRLFFLNRERLKKVTAADVNRVAAFYLKSSNRTTGRYYPTTSPDRVDVPVAGSAADQLKDFKLDTKVSEGEAFDPSPSNIDSRTTRTSVAGQPQLALLTKKNRGESVAVRMTFRMGNANSLKGSIAVSDLAADMLNRGTTTKTRQQIKDEFDRLKARVNFGGSGPSLSVVAETNRENLAATLDLIADVLRNPSFPASEFGTLVDENLSGIEQQRSEPTFQAQIKLQKHLRRYAKDDFRYAMDADETIATYKAATLDQVKAFYAKHYGAQNAQIVVVGDFDQAAVTGQLTKLFGGWKATETYTRMPAVTESHPAINEKILVADKPNAFFIASQVLTVRDDDADFAALTLGNFILGGGFLNSRLAVRIRQKEGLSYGVGSQFQASSLDKDGTFGAFAIYAPENVDKLEAAFKDEMQKALTEGFTEQEVKEAKSGWLQGRSVGRAQDGSIAGTLGNYMFINRTYAWDAELEKKVSALTPADILAAMKRHLDMNKISIVKAGNFK